MYRRCTKLLEALTPAVAATLILALAAASMPAAAQEVRESVPAARSALLRSIDRGVDAAGQASPDGVGAGALSAGASRRAGQLQANPVAEKSSGPGKGRIILAVLGLAVSVGTTYYYVKAMKKQQEKEQAGFRP